MAEQRKHIRVNDSLMISYRLSKETYRTGSRSKDISEGGICFPSSRSFELGTNLELEIHMLGFKKPIVATAEVVWVQMRSDIKYPFLVGVKFIRINLPDRRTLHNYISGISEKGISRDINWIG